MLKIAVEKTLVVAFLMCAGAASAAELHPIVEVQSGYLFGAISDGKWIKAEEAAKALPNKTVYRVYGLTQALGEAKGGKPQPSKGRCVFRRAGGFTLAKGGEGRDRAGRALECAAAKNTRDGYDATSLRRCGARFFENERD
jgi:hypothetical protein